MSSTRVCVRCGWLVLDGARCARDGGPSVEWRAAARAAGVPTLRAVLNLPPAARVLAFRSAVERARARRRSPELVEEVGV